MSDKTVDSGFENLASKATRFEIPRRDFLFLSSAALLGAAASGLANPLVAGVSPETAASQPVVLSVGFWEGLADTDYGTIRTWPLVAADSLRAGDSYFRGAGLVKATIHGFWRPANRRAAPVFVSVLPRYPAQGFDSKLNVLSWHRGQGPNRKSFVVPIAEDGALDIAIDRVLPPPSSRLRAATTSTGDQGQSLAQSSVGQVLSFRTDDKASALKLRRGTYVIAVGQSPNWSSVGIVEKASLLRSDGGPLVSGWLEQPVSFDYLVMSVDYTI
ncbi:MAG TPA: hypothetical protein VEZ11_02215 [Thermoanaerobaculia bacterium]|nr:hypothetical protein [Thermoanaerobaculia bacterium]